MPDLTSTASTASSRTVSALGTRCPAQQSLGRCPLGRGRRCQRDGSGEWLSALQPSACPPHQPGQVGAAEEPAAGALRPPADRSRPQGLRVGRTHRVLAARAGRAVPLPAGDQDGGHLVDAGELGDGDARHLRITGPLPLAGHDHIQVEGVQEPEALGTRVVVHTRERLVQGHQAWCVRAARARVVRGGGGEQGNGHGQDAFASGGGSRGGYPAAVLLALNGELVPGAVVEGGGEVLQPAARRVLGLLAGDLSLQELTDRGPVLGRPGISGLEQAATGLGKADRGLAGGPPHQAQPHTGGSGPFLQLGVHGQHLPLGGCDQLLEGRRPPR